MRIVSLNAWGGAVFDSLIEWLPRCGADIVCLQEITCTAGLDGWTRFDDGERTVPQRANLFDDIRAVLPRYQGVLLTSDTGPVIDDDGRTHRQEFGIATFIDERIAVVGSEASFVHGAFVDHRHAWATSDRPRIAHAVRLIDPDAERAVTVAHLHGLRDAHGKHDTPARHVQADRLAQLVTRVREPQDTTVVCGDLNLLPDSDTFTVLGAVGLVDLVGTADTRTARYTKPIRHANYLLISNPDAVQRFEVLAVPEVSDHRPLVLDL